MSGELAARLALASLPGLGPARAGWLLRAGPPTEVIGALRDGRLPAGVGPAPAGVTAKLVGRWTDELRAADPAAALASVLRLGIEVVGPDHERWPFTEDPDPPMIVFAAGRLELLARRPVAAVVGTRRCTALGRQVAFDLARSLADAGVIIVSGLAVGIDAAAHAGALAAGGTVAGVVATGLDVVYPRANRQLWRRVAGEGLLVSEAPPGTRPERWRFPARNRLIAALADVVIVVESHAEGGALLTAGEAADRGRAVMAVPGSITSPASVGSNQLLRDGCTPVCTVDDVLDTIGWRGRPDRGPATRGGRVGGATTGGGAGETASPLARFVLDQVAAGACHVEQLAGASRATIPELLAEVGRLHALGLIDVDGSTVSVPQAKRPL